LFEIHLRGIDLRLLRARFALLAHLHLAGLLVDQVELAASLRVIRDNGVDIAVAQRQWILVEEVRALAHAAPPCTRSSSSGGGGPPVFHKPERIVFKAAASPSFAT